MLQARVVEEQARRARAEDRAKYLRDYYNKAKQKGMDLEARVNDLEASLKASQDRANRFRRDSTEHAAQAAACRAEAEMSYKQSERDREKLEKVVAVLRSAKVEIADLHDKLKRTEDEGTLLAARLRTAQLESKTLKEREQVRRSREALDVLGHGAGGGGDGLSLHVNYSKSPSRSSSRTRGKGTRMRQSKDKSVLASIDSLDKSYETSGSSIGDLAASVRHSIGGPLDPSEQSARDAAARIDMKYHLDESSPMTRRIVSSLSAASPRQSASGATSPRIARNDPYGSMTHISYTHPVQDHVEDPSNHVRDARPRSRPSSVPNSPRFAIEESRGRLSDNNKGGAKRSTSVPTTALQRG
jgi:hypothetical protein